jgi:hypothetical protein
MPLQPRLDKDAVLIAPQAMTNSATVTANLDTLGASYATIRIALASEINTNAEGPTLSLLESDDTVVTNFATVVADRTDESMVDAASVSYGVDLRGRKRYLRLSITTAGDTNDDATVSAVSTLGRQHESGGSDVTVYV